MDVGASLAREKALWESLEEANRFLEQLGADLKKRGDEALTRTSRSFSELHGRVSVQMDRWQESLSQAAQSNPRYVKLQGELSRWLDELDHFYHETSHRPGIQKTIEAVSQAQGCVREMLETRVLRPSDSVGGNLSVAAAEAAIPLSSRRELQWIRKFWHMFAASFMVWVYAGLNLPKVPALIILGTYVAIMTIADIWRLKNPTLNERVLREFRSVLRRDEADRLNAQTFYGIAAFFTILFFPKPIACLAILYLGFGDVAASVIGLTWGKTPLFGKASLEGSLACFVSCYVVTVFFLLLRFPEFSSIPFVVAGVGAFAATFLEALSGRLNDNLLVPLGSGALISLFILLF